MIMHLTGNDRRRPRDFQPTSARCRSPGARAFTLIEIVGVLVVLCILTTIILSSTTRQLDIAAGDAESTNLVKFAAALQNSISRNRYLPGTNDMLQVIATELGIAVNDVALNPRQNPRLFLFDPTLNLGTNDSFSGRIQCASGDPYRQMVFGSIVKTATNSWVLSPPEQCGARLMIISNLGPWPLPAGVTNGLSAADFPNVWNSADGTVPTNGVWAGWRGSGNDLKIQRINLAPLFVRVIL